MDRRTISRAAGAVGDDQLTQVSADIAEYMQVHHQKRVTPKERQKLRADLKAMFTCTTLKEIYRNFYDWLGRPEMFKLMKGGRYEYADVYPLIYLMKLVESAPPVRRIKHLVVDEVQDYTAVQYRVLDSLYPCNRTILGDCNQ